MPSEYDEVESLISDQSGSYKGLRPEALLTSEDDFRSIISSLPEVQTWVELGSGHGLGPLLFASLNSQKKSIGIEFERPRFEISQKRKTDSGLENVSFIHADLLSCHIPDGDVYFLYFPTGMVLDRILHELGQRENSFKVVAIESHGDLLARLAKESWLKACLHIPLQSQRHEPYAVVFEKCGMKKNSLNDLSFQNKLLLIQDQNGENWLGESYGLEWLRLDQYQLLTPPRTISLSQVQKVLEFDEIESEFHPALQLRKLENLTFETNSGNKVGRLRKIFVSPSFKVEISSGEQVEWSDVKKIFWENTLCFDSSSDYFYYPHVV